MRLTYADDLSQNNFYDFTTPLPVTVVRAVYEVGGGCARTKTETETEHSINRRISLSVTVPIPLFVVAKILLRFCGKRVAYCLPSLFYSLLRLQTIRHFP